MLVLVPAASLARLQKKHAPLRHHRLLSTSFGSEKQNGRHLLSVSLNKWVYAGDILLPSDSGHVPVP
jgi:hypothetical protein